MEFKRIFFTTLFLVLFAGFVGSASAAELFWVPNQSSINVGERLSLDLRVDTEDDSINAAEVRVSFPADNLSAVDFDISDSIFDFWLTEPTIDNSAGTIDLLGGTSDARSGGSLKIATFVFEALEKGEAEVAIPDAVVTKADGSGDNVLTSALSANIGIEVPPAEEEPTVDEPEEEEPQVVTREPVPTGEVPEAPQLSIPLYPDESHWYSKQGDMMVFWEVPEDVTRVAVQVARNPNIEPTSAENQLINGKNLGILQEGVSYVHVRFGNENGWGETTHRRVALDLDTPLPFELTVGAERSQDPTPELTFSTQDSLSGISHYIIYLDGERIESTTSTQIVLSVQAPGLHTAVVRAVDNAGNSIEDSVDFEIVPLQQPQITFLDRNVVQGSAAHLTGTGPSNTSIRLRTENKNGQVVASSSVVSDNSGNWSHTIGEILPVGSYDIYVWAENERGARSFETEPMTFTVGPEAALIIGILHLGWLEIILMLILLLLSVVGAGGWYYVSRKKTQVAYKEIALRDIRKVRDLIVQEVDEMQKKVGRWENQLDSESFSGVQYRLESIRDIADKLDKYITKEVDKLN